MIPMASRPQWLIFGIGNPSRGDDALGSSFVERLSLWLDQPGHAQSLPMDLVLHTDFQCQIEHALDLDKMSGALFVDASQTAPAPYEITQLLPDYDATHTTHALSPACVLAVAERLGQLLPVCWLMGITGLEYQLGAGLSSQSQSCLDQAFNHVVTSLRSGGLFATASGK